MPCSLYTCIYVGTSAKHNCFNISIVTMLYRGIDLIVSYQVSYLVGHSQVELNPLRNSTSHNMGTNCT